jgi:hypothetical protein
LPPKWVLGLVLGLLVASAALTAALLWLPSAGLPKSPLSHGAEFREAAESRRRTTILQFAGGIVLIVGLALTARTVYVSRETHLTDRFNKAVDQLGHERAEVRVGGIHALDRLARNSPADRRLVLEVLTAYLHINASGETVEHSRRRPTPDVQTALSVLTSL